MLDCLAPTNMVSENNTHCSTWDYVKEVVIIIFVLIVGMFNLICEWLVYGGIALWILDVFGIVDVSNIYILIDDTAHIFEIMRWPINFVKDRALEFTGSETFVPSNEGFLLYFQFILYPILYISFNNFCPLWILTSLVLIPIYFITPYSFIDEELTA